jgi:2-polyprenyl-3-methyl-5-hydroxy-6-metoxy-1,4-benzoquinol methylase
MSTVAVMLGNAAQAAELVRAVGSIPSEVIRRLGEILVLVQEGSLGEIPRELRELERVDSKVRVQLDPRSYGYGGRRKVAYEYALGRGFDHVVVLEPDGRYAPERLGELLDAAEGGAEFVIASGSSRGSAALNFALGLEVRDYASPYRIVSCGARRRIPFHLNEDGRGFDTELLIQARALGLLPREIEMRLERDERHTAAYALAAALRYRAHQLHLTRRGQFYVERGIRYTLKHHPSSSHSQVLDAIRPGARVLDLGCSQGLLAAPLKARGVTVVGVDVRDESEISHELDRYHRRDLEQPLSIPEGRVFDYVVCSDVIEHVVRRAELLRSVRRYLLPEGRLLISTPNIAIWFYRLSLLAGRFEYGPRGVLDETHVHLFTRASFRREIESAAFRVVRERFTALPFEIVFESTGRSSLVRGLASAYHGLARLWPEMFAYQFLIEAEAATLLDSPGD